MSDPRRILVVRRDNIGDLVLTTPLISALRRRFSAAWIGVLGNTYNTPVLAGHPDIDELFAYDKAKHQPQRSRFSVYADTARLLLRMRAARVDLAILAGPGVQQQAARLAQWVRPRAMLGFVLQGMPAEVTIPVAYADGALLHEAEDVFRLGGPLGLSGAAGPCTIAAGPDESARFRAALATLAPPGDRIVALHVSARRLRQRWPAGHFAALARLLCAAGDVTVVLLWAPGAGDDPRHPGDDAKAATIIAQTQGAVRCLPWPTTSLAQLAGALAGCHLMICADGGAMHMAAGLGVPIVALFGDSPVRRWRPWGVLHEVLQASSGNAEDIAVSTVQSACERVLAAAR